MRLLISMERFPPVIRSANNYLTAKVPVDVDKNIRVKVKGLKHNVEAVCPGTLL